MEIIQKSHLLKAFIGVGIIGLVAVVGYMFLGDEVVIKHEAPVVTQNTISSSSLPVASLATTSDEVLVKRAFEGYKYSLLNKDGVSAVTYVDSHTISYYNQMLELTKYGSKKTIQERSIIDQMIVLITRQLFDKATISTLENGRDYIEFAIEKGLIGEDQVKIMVVNSVQVVGDKAYIELVADGKVLPIKFTAQKEQGKWLIDITSVLPLAEEAFQALFAQSGLTNEEMIVYMLENLSGRPVTDEIWNVI
ncbi:MAG: hypothetical protein RLY57_182 [Candidatus Parcubacteria bacterium]|jgi:hypothetical protein